MSAGIHKTVSKQRWRGIAAAPGIALGPAFVYRVSQTKPSLRRLRGNREVAAESRRLGEALVAVKKELQQLKSEAGATIGSALGRVFDAQVMIVDDPMIVSEVESVIAHDRIGAENAFTRVVDNARRAIARSSDPYLREMINDIDAVKTRVINQILGVAETLNKPLLKPAIVLAANITPSDIVSLRRDLVLGIVTESGGETSHTALLAKSLKIPAVVGVGLDLRTVRPGSLVAVDGFNGQVFLGPDQAKIDFFERKKKRTHSPWPKKYERLRTLPAITRDRRRVHLMANIDLAGEARAVEAVGADGVGLYRTEYLFLEKGSYPAEREQVRVYRRALEALDGRSIVVRTFDLGSDKALPDFPYEPNPALGLRGVRLALRHPRGLRTQLRSLLAASAHGPLAVMIPMVSDMEELTDIRRHWLEAKAALRTRGVKFNSRTPLGIMIETPAAVRLAPELAKRVDFFSIGTNDLQQYTLAADRGNRSVTSPLDKWHPALWRQIAEIVRAGRRAKCPVSLCGELASDILAVPFLLGLGLTSLSSQPNSIPRIKALVRCLRYSEARKAAAALLTKSTRADVLKLARQFAAKHPPVV